MKPKRGLSASPVGWKEGTILSVGSTLSQLGCLPGLFTLVNGNVKDAQGETPEAQTQLRGTSPRLVTFGTFSGVSLGTEPRGAVPCLWKWGQTTPVLEIECAHAL